MKLTADQLRQLSREIDVVMDLPKSEWHTWMNARRPGDQAVDQRLHHLLTSGELERSLAEGGDCSDTSDGEKDDLISIARLGQGIGVNTRRNSENAGALIGPYRLQKLISQGGMGSVWLAERADGAYARRLALKLPFVGRHAELLAARFAVERDILARLEHQNIARFYDAGVVDGVPYIALEYVQGLTITEYCRVHTLSLSQRLMLFKQVLRAVGHAHQHLIIHRDIKPSNVLVNDEQTVKLLDFGISRMLQSNSAFVAPSEAVDVMHNSPAHAASPDLTLAFGNVLTPRYASPEQLTQQSISTASDVYSLGVLLYTLLTGRSPYDFATGPDAPANELAGVLDAIRQTARAAMQRIDNTTAFHIDADLEAIVWKALSIAPQDRYASPAEFADDLARYQASRPVRARAPTARYVATRFIQKHWIAVGTIAAGFAAVSTFAALIYHESEVQRRTKEFLLQALTPSSYYTDGGGVLTHVEMLNRAAKDVGVKFASEPRVAAEIYQAVGESLFNLGEHESAFNVRTQAQPVVDQVFGRTSREALKNAGRAAYMHLTQRRFKEFLASLEDLKTRCPSLSTVPEDKCYGLIWMQTQYYAYVGDPYTRNALWSQYDAAISPTVGAESRWHEIANYWGAGAARQAGDMVLAKARWKKLLSRPGGTDNPRGEHMVALSIARTLTEMGFAPQAAPLARAVYEQGERWMGDAFDPRQFYAPSVSLAESASGVDAGADAWLRRGIAKVEASSNPNVDQESADTRAALSLSLIAKGRYAEAREPLAHALQLLSANLGSATQDYHQDVVALEMQTVALNQLEALNAADSASSGASAAQGAVTLSELRVRALAAKDPGMLPKIDALLAALADIEGQPSAALAHWQRAIDALLLSHARPPEIAVFLRALKSPRSLPPPVQDATVDAMNAYAQKVLSVTEAALVARRNAKP